jgi:hypothetical protein
MNVRWVSLPRPPCQRTGPAGAIVVGRCIRVSQPATWRETGGPTAGRARRHGDPGVVRHASCPGHSSNPACGGLPLVRMPADVRYRPGRNGSVPTASTGRATGLCRYRAIQSGTGGKPCGRAFPGVDRPWITRSFPGVGRSRCGVSASPPRMRAVWAGRRLLQAPPRLRRSACGSDGTGSLCSRTTAVLRAFRARLCPSPGNRTRGGGRRHDAGGTSRAEKGPQP